MSDKAVVADRTCMRWVPEYARLLANLHAIVEESHLLTQGIRDWFPVEGLPWVFEGSQDDAGATCNIVNVAARLDRLLYPLRLPFDATLYDEIRLLNAGSPPEQFLDGDVIAGLKSRSFRDSEIATRYGFASFTGSPSSVIEYVKRAEAMRHIPAHLYTALRAVRLCHDRLLTHYQWGRWVAGGTAESWPWQWPGVPPVPQSHLRLLDDAATRLGALAASEQSKVEQYVAPTGGDGQPAQSTPAEGAAGAGSGPPGVPRPRRMTRTEANDKAKELAKKLKKAFFALSEREQAKRIGCHLKTWKKTPLYQEAKRKKAKNKPPGNAPAAPGAVPFTATLEAAAVEGGRDEVLNQLIAEQEADSEPSPLEDDPPGWQPPKVRVHKRP
jgi:hypothetical protein